MLCTEELEPIEVKEAREALNLLLAEGKPLWKTYKDDFGGLQHWLGLSHTALEPLPQYQEQFRLLCGNRRRSAGERLSAGIHILESTLKAMDAGEVVQLENPSLHYRSLLASLPD